jgi:hypothetical protein
MIKRGDFRTEWSRRPARDKAFDASISNAEIGHSLVAHSSFRKSITSIYCISVRPATSGAGGCRTGRLGACFRIATPTRLPQ